MNWQTITIAQYQQVYATLKSFHYDDFEKEIQITALLSGKTEAQVEALTMPEYKKLKQQVSFVFQDIPKEGRRIHGWKRYRIIYDLRRLGSGRYVTVQNILRGDLVENLHQLLAVVVEKRNHVGQYRYDARKHQEYANDLQQAPFLACYHAAVFFCNLWNLSIHNLAPYLEKEAKAKGVSPNLITEAMTHLSKSSVGS